MSRDLALVLGGWTAEGNGSAIADNYGSGYRAPALAEALNSVRYPMLDLTVAMVRVPVRPGRNLATIIEVAARNQLLKLQGHNSAVAFQERLNRAIAEATPRRNFDVDVIE